MALATTQAGNAAASAASAAAVGLSVVNPNLNARASADYLQSDGATSNRRIENKYGALGAVGGSDLTFVGDPLVVPTANPGASAIIFALTSSNSATPTGINYALVLYIATNGDGILLQNDATAGTDFRKATYSGFRAAYSGKTVRPVVALSGASTSAPVIWIDGVDISASFTVTTGGGGANWVDASTPTTYFLQGYAWPAGPFRPGRLINRKFAQADVDFVQATGKLAASASLGGSMVNLLTANDSSFGGVSTNWTNGNFGGTATLNTTTHALDCTSAGSNSTVRNVAAITSIMPIWFRISGTLSAVTGGTVKVGTGTQGSGFFDYYLTGLGNGAFVGYIYTLRGNQIHIGMDVAGSYTLDDLSVIQCGALSDPIIQRCQVLDDATPNGMAAIMVGFTPVTPKKEWRVPAFVDMSGTGNKQLLSGAFFNGPTSQALDSIDTVCTGTPTFSIGDGTTATKYTASVAHSAGNTRETLSTNYPADSAKTGIYANVTVGGGAAEKIVIRGHRK